MGAPFVIQGAPGAAVIGGGFIGPVHVEALRRIGVEVVGLLGSSPDRAAPVADRLGIPRVYRDLEELLDDDRAGVVHVASPNASHFDQVPRILESGRHVICEKPLATTSAETSVLRKLAESRPEQAAAVNYNIRYYPLCREVRDRIAAGSIGRVLSVTGSYVQDWLLYPEDYNWRVEPSGGSKLRAVADIGTHWMDLAQYLVGEPIGSVCADLATFHPRQLKPTGPTDTFTGSSEVNGRRETQEVEIVTDDHAAVLLRFASGMRGSFHVSQVTAGRKNRLTFEIAGTEGSFAWDSEDPDRLWIGGASGAEPDPDAGLLAARRRRRRDGPLSGRARRGLPGHLQAALHRRLRLDRRRPGGRPRAGVPDLRRWRSRGPPLRGHRPIRRGRRLGRRRVASDGGRPV